MNPRPAKPSAKYRAILDTAEAHFGALGFKKANVDVIAAQAGVSKPLIYRYFDGKKQLFEVVVERVISEWCDVISAEGARATPGAAHSLQLVLTASLDFASSRPVLRGLLARESQLLLYSYSDVLDRGTSTLRSVIRDVLARGIADGEIRRDLDLEPMVDVITEVCEGFADRLMSGRTPDADPKLLETIVETVLHGVVLRNPATPD
jgi:AcrR family transcriptional regulator